MKNKKKWAFLLVLLLLLTVTLPVQAIATNQDTNQVIFLLDGSKSMANERWQEALDSVLMIDAMLPADYQTALLVYSEGIDASVGFDQSLEEYMVVLEDMKQQGYTNTGVALETALEMFDRNHNGKKHVVIISDGEISMSTSEKTETAVGVYLDAVSQAADNGVILHYLLYETEDIEDQVSDGAERTGGLRFHRTENNTAEDFAENFLFHQLGLERTMLGLADSADSMAELSLQDTYAERAKILLTTDSRIEDIQVSCRSKAIHITQGDSFAAILLEQPLEDAVSLQYTLAEKGRLNAFLVKEYSLAVSAAATYVPETGNQQLQIRVVTSDGRNILENQEVRDAVNIYIDGEKTPYEVSRGIAVITWPAETSKEITLRADLSGLNSVVYCEGTESSLWLEVPVPEQEKEDHDIRYFWLCVVIAGVCVVFVILLYLLVRSNKKKTERPKVRVQRHPILMRY